MGNKKARRLNVDMVSNALHETKGAVYMAANRLQCSHQAVYDYINKYESVADIKAFYDGELVDIAELRTRTAVIDGEPWAVKMVLMTKGKARGWVERTEIAGPDGGPLAVEHTHHLAEVSDDDLRRNLAAFGRAALAASGRAPIPDDSGGAAGDDSESESRQRRGNT